MKKFLALLLALTMALALVACGGGDDEAASGGESGGETTGGETSGEFEEMTWKFACSATGPLPGWTAPRSSPVSSVRRPAVPSPFSTIPLTS